jgi:hypothetical protein
MKKHILFFFLPIVLHTTITIQSMNNNSRSPKNDPINFNNNLNRCSSCIDLNAEKIHNTQLVQQLELGLGLLPKNTMQDMQQRISIINQINNLNINILDLTIERNNCKACSGRVTSINSKATSCWYTANKKD